jgi:hypothetical protein
MTCDACSLAEVDGASHVLSVAVVTTPGSPIAINAGELALSVSPVPTVKRFMFRVRY